MQMHLPTMKSAVVAKLAAVMVVLTAIFTSQSVWADTPLRIQCVGDSITAGYTDNPTWSVPFGFGYRSTLYTRLTNAGYSFDYVGGSLEPWNGVFGVPTSVTNTTTSPDLRYVRPGSNQDKHRGYGGWGTAAVQSNIASWIAADNPDIVLLMIGINDGGSEAARTNLYNIVNTITTNKPNAEVIVAQITPMSAAYTTTNATIVSYNNYIRDTLVPTFQGLNKHVSTVDQYSNLLTNGVIDTSLFSNGINHPGATAYDRMAATWFAGIQAVHPIPEPGTMSLLLTAGLALLGFAWRRRK